MNIADNIIKNRLENVYFLWGRGKTTIANQLHEKKGFYIYSVDEARDRLYKQATPEDQPYMCRDFVKEYGVVSFWELPKEVIAEREKSFLEEVTPMIVAELIALAPQHEVIICEGDIDYAAIMRVASHAVYLRNCGTTFDWFERPDHIDMLEAIKRRTDLTEKEKASVIENAYRAVSQDESVLPEWIMKLGVKNIDWDNNTSIEETTQEVVKYFGF